MAFSRSFLKSCGLTDEQISSIMEEHTNVVDALKNQRDGYKADAEKLPGVQQELDALKNGEDFKAKYEQEHKAFDEYKQTVAKNEQLEKTKAAYRKLLLDEKINEKRLDGIIRLTDFEKIKLDKDGNLADLDALKAGIDKEWGEFKVNTVVKTDKPSTPPTNDNGGSDNSIRAMTAKWHSDKYGQVKTTEKG